MILPSQAAGSQPVAYSGGQKSSTQPGFGAALTAMLVQMQATAPAPSGLSAQSAHHHHHGAGGERSATVIGPPKLP